MGVDAGAKGTQEGRNGESAFNRWIEGQDENSQRSRGKVNEEPNTIEITYLRSGFEDTIIPESEVVFEDPADCEKRPRLLVSLQSVLALKALCEREFGRVEALTKTITSCRTAYFKELLWLREQLIVASNPEMQVTWDEVMSYEVFWYDPPSYVDTELKEFMKDCNRITNKKLIEENYELRVKLGGDVKENPDPDELVKKALKKLGTNKLIKREYAILGTKEFGGPDAQKEFADICKEVLGIKDEKPKAVLKDDRDDEIARLQKELEAMKLIADSIDELRKAYKNAMKELEEQKKLTAAEKARADAERERAEAERQRAEQLQKAMQGAGGDKGGAAKAEIQAMQQVMDKAAGAIQKSTDELAKKMNISADKLSGGSKPKEGPAGAAGVKLDTALQALQKLSGMKPNIEPQKVEVVREKVVEGKTKTVVTGDDSALKDRIAQLEKELEQALQDARDARAETEAVRLASKKALEEARVASNRPPGDDSALADAEARIKALLKERDSLREQVEELNQREADYKKKIDKLNGEISTLKASKGGKGDPDLQRKFDQAMEQIEALAMKCTELQEKIKELKAELRKYKLAAGEDPGSDDDGDEELEGGMPKFLIHYFRRIKNSPKPRWQLLSEDSKHAKLKRDWLFASKTRLMTDKPAVSGAQFLAPEAPAANAAFNFLRGGPAQAVPQPSPGNRSRSPQPPLANMLRGQAQTPMNQSETSFREATPNAAALAAIAPGSAEPDEEPPVYIIKPGHTVSPYIRAPSSREQGDRSGSPSGSLGLASQVPSPLNASATSFREAQTPMSTSATGFREASATPLSPQTMASASASAVSANARKPRGRSSSPTAVGTVDLNIQVTSIPSTPSNAVKATRPVVLNALVAPFVDPPVKPTASKALMADLQAVAGYADFKAVGSQAAPALKSISPSGGRQSQAGSAAAASAAMFHEKLQAIGGAIGQLQQHPLLTAAGKDLPPVFDTPSDAVGKALRNAALKVGEASAAVVSSAKVAAAASRSPSTGPVAVVGSSVAKPQNQISANTTAATSSGWLGGRSAAASMGTTAMGTTAMGATSASLDGGKLKLAGVGGPYNAGTPQPSSTGPRSSAIGSVPGRRELPVLSGASGYSPKTASTPQFQPPEATGMDMSPTTPGPARRFAPARSDQLFNKSRSTGSLPLTNAGKTMTTVARTGAEGSTKSRPPVEAVGGVQPGVFNQLPPGRVLKGAQPYWLAGN